MAQPGQRLRVLRPDRRLQLTGLQPLLPALLRLRIGGLVVPGSVVRDPQSLKVAFKLVDNGGHLVTVEFDGILPDLFREGQGIVAQGTLKDATTVAAFEVLAKHDENYMPPEVADATNGMHFKPEYTEAQLQGAKQ